jgi:hypothetical protein
MMWQRMVHADEQVQVAAWTHDDMLMQQQHVMTRLLDSQLADEWLAGQASCLQELLHHCWLLASRHHFICLRGSLHCLQELLPWTPIMLLDLKDTAAYTLKIPSASYGILAPLAAHLW